MNTRRIFTFHAISLVALCAYSLPATAQNSSKNTAKTPLLPCPADMQQLAASANARGEPMVLMVSLPGCPWCELLRRNYLGPMQSEGVAAYEFMINERSRSLTDFKAQRITPAAMSSALKIAITPTLLFFNTQGNEIAPRIEGVASADFIGAILDERLRAARERLKAAR
jgi:thioredoxin-related protein